MDGFWRRALPKEKRPPGKTVKFHSFFETFVHVHNSDGRFNERVNICRVSKDHIASSCVISSLDTWANIGPRCSERAM